MPGSPSPLTRPAERSSARAARNRETETMLANLRRAGLKMTPQRIALVKLFATDDSHPTAQALFEKLRPDFPSMSFATVYNTLDALTRAGLASTLRLGQAARFDPNTVPHHHTVCDLCGEVRDVPANDEPGDDERRLSTARTSASGKRHQHAFAVRVVERVYRGICSACRTQAAPMPRALPPEGPGTSRRG